ncbi:hypothetical protein B1H18_05940 [Streptomyces tsukubensis]|uniref:HTH luxR-type domain-containing protein n=2 Tax=Streptomyces tsukubensis TaxID=83656 RepID=A0A1V4AD50_9ACTN|nr:hypothetical protein B1H18_05940 [Streptomyces tsukubensis]
MHGRATEWRAVSTLLDRTGSGGGALLVTAGPGFGRTTLLEHAAHAPGSRHVLRARGVLAESRIPYGGLHAVRYAALDGGRRGASAVDTGGQPPADQRRRAGRAAEAQDGLLTLLREVGARGPVLLCVDDAHLWDAPSRAALGFAARRAHAVGPVVLLVSVAGHRAADPDFAGLPVLDLGPLPRQASEALLDDLPEAPKDPAVRAELLVRAAGNPALLLALVRRLSAAERAGHAVLPDANAEAELLGELLNSVLGPPLTAPSTLGPSTGPGAHLALVAAAAHEHEREGAGADARLVHRAATLLARAAGLAAVPGTEAPGTAVPGAAVPGVAVPAADAPKGRTDFGTPGEPGTWPDVLRVVGARVHFTADLIRRAVYATAPPGPRGSAHRALARLLEADGRPLAALLHRALAAPAPSPALAAELARAAADPATPDAGRLRGAALARAAELAGDEGSRARWRTDAAEHALRADRPHEARRLLLAAVSGGPAPRAVRGRAELLRGRMALREGPMADAHASLMLAASLLGPTGHGATEARLAAADAAWAAGDVTACLTALGAGTRDPDPAPEGTWEPPAVSGTSDSGPVLEGVWEPPAVSGTPNSRPAPGGAWQPPAVSLPPPPHGVRPAPRPAMWGGGRTDLARDYGLGMRALLEARLDRAARPLRRVLEQAREEDTPEVLLRAGAAALLLGDVGAACGLGARALAAARAVEPGLLVPRALEHLAYAELRAGRHARARAHAEEGLRAALRSGQVNLVAHHHAVLALAASIEGDTKVVAGHVAAARVTARRNGLAQAATLAEWAAGRTELGRGRLVEAAARLGPLVRPGGPGGHFAVRMLVMPCAVEAAVLAGRPEEARATAEEFALWADFGADAQALPQLARCKALLAPPEMAGPLFEQALALHEQCQGGDFEQARTQLLYGKWLRRRRRPREAGDRLREALTAFDRCGAHLWAEQARGELRAGGAGVSDARAGALTCLTPQQLRIARCVAEGATNREVALRLSVSTRTVDHHLRNVFAQLGVRSRVELARLVERTEKTGARP